jgi:hypothetical protein
VLDPVCGRHWQFQLADIGHLGQVPELSITHRSAETVG